MQYIQILSLKYPFSHDIEQNISNLLMELSSILESMDGLLLFVQKPMEDT